jgi:hypothetical protein
MNLLELLLPVISAERPVGIVVKLPDGAWAYSKSFDHPALTQSVLRT